MFFLMQHVPINIRCHTESTLTAILSKNSQTKNVSEYHIKIYRIYLRGNLANKGLLGNTKPVEHKNTHVFNAYAWYTVPVQC